MSKKLVGLTAAALALLAFLALPFGRAAAASGSSVNSVYITVQLQQDGSALISEQWDLVAADDITEWYLQRTELDQQDIWDFTVREGDVEFENIGQWDINRSLQQKRRQCGIVPLSDGYELCWGVGSAGPHVFTLSYRMSNLVKAYADADVIYQRFINDLADEAGYVEIRISYPAMPFTVENTGIWGGGSEGEIHLVNGEIVANSTGGAYTGSSFWVLVQFAKGMFTPGVQRSESFESLKERALSGTGYEVQEAGSGGTSNYGGPGGNDVFDVANGFFSSFGRFFSMAVVPFGIFIVILVLRRGLGRGGKAVQGWRPAMRPEYKDPAYSRALPYRGNLPASYARLSQLRQLENDGVIIGAYLLRWLRSGQVGLVKQAVGVFATKQEDALQMHAPSPGMPEPELSLYKMLVNAAGEDGVLQSKEFEKYSRRNYEKVESWFTQYKNMGMAELHVQGAVAYTQRKTFFGLASTKQATSTPLGRQLTVQMFGFKKYLEDFTIINERQATEVQLWDEYLVFAQVFGIADQVAAQFKQLYPDYFTQMAQRMGYTDINMFDIYMFSRIAGNFGRAAYTGYRSGYSAAHSATRFGGGGGGFSGGGGGFGASGGGSSGGR